MVVNCETVWLEVSNYIDGEVESELRVAIEEHIRGCQGCAAVVAGTRNVIEIYGDERMLEVPFGFSQRLHRRLDADMPKSRRSFLGWMVAAAAAVLVAGSFEITRLTSHRADVPSQVAQHGTGVPPEMKVVAAETGKLFHVPGCTYIVATDKLRPMTAREAYKEGYSPCVHCLKKYLASADGVHPIDG
jgi:hypothetical protein